MVLKERWESLRLLTAVGIGLSIVACGAEQDLSGRLPMEPPPWNRLLRHLRRLLPLLPLRSRPLRPRRSDGST